MFRIILRRYGIATVTLGLTLISILLSVGISWGMNALLKGGPMREGVAIAIIVPLFIAPIMNVQILRLLLQLDQAEQRLQFLSHTDDLTQTYNRRYFMQYIDQEFKRAQRYGEIFSVAILRKLMIDGGILLATKYCVRRPSCSEVVFDRQIFVRGTGAMNLFFCFRKPIDSKPRSGCAGFMRRLRQVPSKSKLCK
jgi:hypothetical protein